jgi:hypothetical protein
MAERRGVYRVFVGKPKGNRPLGRPRLRLDLQEVGLRGMDWIELEYGQVVGTFECGKEITGSIKRGEFLD